MPEADSEILTARSPARLADITREAYIYFGAGATVVLQMANPGVGLGVARHSATLQRWTLFKRWAPRLYWLAPAFLRHLPARFYLHDLRKRMATQRAAQA